MHKLKTFAGLFWSHQFHGKRVKEILKHLRKIFAYEQEFFNKAQVLLQKEFDQVQKQLSHLNDEYLYSKIDTVILLIEAAGNISKCQQKIVPKNRSIHGSI